MPRATATSRLDNSAEPSRRPGTASEGALPIRTAPQSTRWPGHCSGEL
jgi:hypothetical protein